MGIIDAVSDVCACPTVRTRWHIKKRKQFPTVEMKVPIYSERKICRDFDGMEGITGVEVVPKQKKVAVTAYVDPAKVMRRLARKTG